MQTSFADERFFSPDHRPAKSVGFAEIERDGLSLTLLVARRPQYALFLELGIVNLLVHHHH